MRTLIAAACLAAVLIPPAGAEDAEAKMRAELFTGCHGVFHAMTLLAERGQYAKDPAANAAGKDSFAIADEKSIELARDAYKVNGDSEETATENLDSAAEEYETAFDELTLGGSYNRAKMEEEVNSCFDLLKDE